MGVLGEFGGVAVHDGWTSYAGYGDRHGLCNAHHLRELTFVWEDRPATLGAASCQRTSPLETPGGSGERTGTDHLSVATVKSIEWWFEHLLRMGMRANPPPALAQTPGRGRKKRGKAGSLVDWSSPDFVDTLNCTCVSVSGGSQTPPALRKTQPWPSTRKAFSPLLGLTRPSGRPPLLELLIFRRCGGSKVRMKALTIIEDLHVFKYLFPGLLLASVDLSPNQLCSQGLEERFRACVVPAVAPAAHAFE